MKRKNPNRKKRSQGHSEAAVPKVAAPKLPPGVEILQEQLQSEAVRAQQLAELRATLKATPDSELLERYGEFGETREEIESAAIGLLLAVHAEQDAALQSRSELQKEEAELAQDMAEMKREALRAKMKEPAAQIKLAQELGGKVCRCGAAKRPRQTFCGNCFKRLSPMTKKALYRSFGNGYEEAYVEAVRQLAEGRGGARGKI